MNTIDPEKERRRSAEMTDGDLERLATAAKALQSSRAGC
jgi:hypothetical protein